MDEQQLNELIKALNNLTGKSSARAKAAADELKVLKAKQPFTTQERRQLIDKLAVAKDLLKEDKKQLKLVEKVIEGQRDLIKSQEDLVEGIRKVGNSFVGLGKAAFQGQGSISAFTDNILGLKTIGNRLDVNIETFRQLSLSGANFGKSIVDLREAAAAATLPLDDFAALVANNSSNLAALFGSTTQGAKQIALLGTQTRELGKDRLTPLGFTVDEINETLLLNLDSQRRTGVLNQLTDRQRIDSAINFAEELDRLAKLTGAQRDELRSQIDAQKSNERFQVALQGQTEETRQRLQGFAASVAQAEPALATGIQDLIANAGRPVTDASIELVQNIPQIRGVIENLINGTNTSAESLALFAALVPESVERLKNATVTGQLGFTSLQGPLLNFRDRIFDINAVTGEQNKSASELVKNLTSFEQATKVLASQFQGIETGLLKAFGPQLGKLIGGVQEMFKGGGVIADTLKNSPALTAGLFAGLLTGKFLFNKAAQIGIVAAGTRIGTAHIMPSGMSAGAIGKKGLKGGLGIAGGIGLAAGGAGMAATSETAGGKAMGVLSSAAGGAMIGSVIPGVGTLVGAGVGTLVGLAGLAMNSSNKRQFGGGMDAGKTYLTGERGPELITAGTASAVTANSDLQKTFNTAALEQKMTSMLAALNTTNQSLANVANGVNTLVTVEARALKAVETTARKDRNQVGIV